jgi:hypothetical protein
MGPPEEENGRPRDAHPGKRPHGERPATGRLSDERAGRHRPYRAEPRGPLADRDRDLTAYHEAGHVLGYVLTGHAHRIEAVTVEPTAEARGEVRMVPAPIPIWDRAVVAALGPLAQGIRGQVTDDDDDDSELCDYIKAALWTGGDEDAKAAAGIFDADPAVADHFADVARRHWPAIERLARLLVERGTVTGTEALAAIATALLRAGAS